MKLFDERTRRDKVPRRHAETSFRYLDHSAIPRVSRTRLLVENWFSHYPEEEQSELKLRLFSNDETTCLSAFFELYLHELMLRLGYEVEIHPFVGADKSPDFLARSDSGDSFCLEAAVVSSERGNEIGKSKVLGRILDAINAIKCADFDLIVDIREKPNKAPSLKRLVADIACWLNRLDYAKARSNQELYGITSLPELQIPFDECCIVASAFPRGESERGKQEVRVYQVGPELNDCINRVRKKVRSKATAYRELGKPYIIAVNALPYFTSLDHIEQALFGRVRFGAEPILRSLPRESHHRGDAALTESKNTRVSAVLAVTRITPGRIGSENAILYRNPWAKHHYNGKMTRLKQGIVRGDELTYQDGLHPRQIFGLSGGWPETA